MAWVVCEQRNSPNDKSLSKAGISLSAQGIGETDFIGQDGSAGAIVLPRAAKM